uniref:Uncharacterized protein n=1 Tax=Lymantria dispar multicapsid nuclear polyhedrosis virus TaxID=10449 RepID=A0A1B1MQZ6_NPVLD|nr:hypothetical protein [Lymantria dispar multiple nucleopolyhedrovirus]
MSTLKNKLLVRSLIRQQIESGASAAICPDDDWRVISVRSLKKIAHALVALREANLKLEQIANTTAANCNLQYKNFEKILIEKTDRINRLLSRRQEANKEAESSRKNGRGKQRRRRRHLLFAVRHERTVCFWFKSVTASANKIRTRHRTCRRARLSFLSTAAAALCNRNAALNTTKIVFSQVRQADAFVRHLKKAFSARRRC